MIIIDEGADPSVRKTPPPPRHNLPSPNAGPSQPLLEPQQSSFLPHATADAPSEPPPAYPGYQTFPQPQSPSPATPPSRKKRITPGRRFLRAFFIAVFVLVLSQILFSSKRHSSPKYPWEEDWWPIPRTGDSYDFIGCSGLWDTTKAYDLSYSLPSSAKDFFVVSQSDRTTGSVRLIHDPSLHDEIRVVVHTADLSRREREALAGMSLCQFRAGENALLGVVLTTLGGGRSSSQRTQLNMTVTVPTYYSYRRSRPSILVNTPFHAIEANLPDTLPFDRVDLRTRQSPIRADSIHGASLFIQTTGDRIHGTYIASNSVELLNEKGPIEATVVARNDGKDHRTQVKMITSGERLQATLALESTKASGRGGAFDIVAKTSESSLGLFHSSMPPGAELHLEVTTSHGPATVKLDESYEGAFALAATRAEALVYSLSHKDPLGTGRKHTIFYDEQRRSLITGSVYWGRENKGTSNSAVNIRTTNGPAQLHV